MLAQLRNMTRGWVAYVLLFLLTIAFAIWGINDIFTGVGSRDLATIGGRSITPAQLTREINLVLEYQRNQGVSLTTQEAIDRGFHRQLLDEMINGAATYEYATKLGVDASNRMVADQIRNFPGVLNPVTGQFDRNAYAQFLQQRRFTQGEFEEQIRADLTRPLLLNSLVIGTRTPSSFGSIFYTYQAEERIVSMAEAPASIIGAIAPPTNEQVQQFWEEQQDNLRVPEFRALTIVYARAADFVSRVSIPEARLQEEIEARRIAATQPERRTFVRITAQNQAQATDIAARLTRGDAAAPIGSALGVPASTAENQARAEVTDAAVAEAVFAMQRGQTRIVRGALSPFVVVRVDTITAAVSPDMGPIRETSRQALALDGAAELLNTAVSAFEDARAGGADIDVAARQAGLTVVLIPAVEAQGRDLNRQPIAALEGHEEVLSVAFQTPEGEASDFVSLGDSDVIVAVTSITPARVQSVDEVRDELVIAWTARERSLRLREVGERVVAAIRGGQSFADATRANRFNISVRSGRLTREVATQVLGRFAPQVFAAQEGEAVSSVAPNAAGVAVAFIETIERPVASEHPQEIEAVRLEIEQSVRGAVAEALQGEIVARVNVRRNERLLGSAFPPTATAEGEDAAQ